MNVVQVGPSEINTGKARINLPHKIRQLETVGSLVLVLLDPDCESAPKENFANVIAFRSNGDLAWIAEPATPQPHDVYYRISKTEPITLYSFSSYACVISPDDGSVIGRTFFK